MTDWISRLKESSPSTLAEIINNLALVIDSIRPAHLSDFHRSEEKIIELTLALKEDEALSKKMSGWLNAVIEQGDFTSLFVHGGISADDTFFGEISRKLKHKILPPLEEENSLQFILGVLFKRRMISNGWILFRIQFGLICFQPLLFIVILCIQIFNHRY